MKDLAASTWRQGTQKIHPDDIERTVKKTAESIEEFESIYAKLVATTSRSHRERYIADLKVEVSKLRRHRSQIKGRLTMKDIKDKSLLKRCSKLIENHLETFAILDRERKIQAGSQLQTSRYSDTQVDPEKKQELGESLQGDIVALSLQKEQADAAIDSLRSKPSDADSARVKAQEALNNWRSWNLDRLEVILRLLDNDSAPFDSITRLQDRIEDLVLGIEDRDLDYEDVIRLIENSQDIYDGLLPRDERLNAKSPRASDDPQTVPLPAGAAELLPATSFSDIVDPSTSCIAANVRLSGFQSASDPGIPLLIEAALEDQKPEIVLSSLRGSDTQYIIDYVQHVRSSAVSHICTVASPLDTLIDSRRHFIWEPSR